MIENETEIHGRDRTSGRWKVWTALPLMLLAATKNHFNILDDEVARLLLKASHM